MSSSPRGLRIRLLGFKTVMDLIRHRIRARKSLLAMPLYRVVEEGFVSPNTKAPEQTVPTLGFFVRMKSLLILLA